MVEQIKNGGFEDASVWVLTGILRDNTKAHTGTWSVNVYSGYATQSIGNIPVNSMVHFTLYAEMPSGNDPNTYVRITYSDATYTDVSLSGIGITWAQKNILASLTAGKTVTQIKLQGGTTQPCWIDDVSLDSPSPPAVTGGGPKNLGFLWFLLSVSSRSQSLPTQLFQRKATIPTSTRLIARRIPFFPTRHKTLIDECIKPYDSSVQQ